MELLNPAHAVLKLRGSAAPAGPFDWANYTDLKERYVFNDIDNMSTNKSTTFNDGNHLSLESAVATAYPISVCGWMKASTNSAVQTPFSIGASTSNDEYQEIIMLSTGELRAQSRADGGAAAYAESAGTYDDNAWHFAGAVFTATSPYQKLYADATTASGSTGVTMVETLNRTGIAIKIAQDINPFEGVLDNWLVFNTALTDAEMDYIRTNKSTYAQLVIDYAAAETNCPDPANCVAAWKLDEEDGLRKDVSGNANHMTPRMISTAANFVKGSSDLIRNTSASPQASMPMSMVCWHKSSDALSLGNFMVNRDGDGSDYFILYKTATDEVAFKKRNGTTTIGVQVANSDVDAADGAWHMSTGVAASGTSIICYSDAFASPEETTSNTPGTCTDFDVGAWVSSQFVTAEMQWLMVYSKALTQAEHLWLWNGGKGRSEYEMANSTDASNPGAPDHLWKLDEASGNRLDTYGSFTLTDASSVGSTSGVLGINHNPYQTAGTVYAPPQLENTGMKFDGVDDYLTNVTANWRGSDTSGSVSIWFKSSEKDAVSIYLLMMGTTGATTDEIGFYLLNGVPRILRNVGGAGATACQFGSTDWRDGEWHHIVYVSTGSAYNVWVDGVSQAAGANDDGTWFGDLGTTGTQTLASPHGGSLSAHIILDEVSVWSDQLTITEVNLLRASGAGLTSAGLDGSNQLNSKQCVNWWGLNEWAPGGELVDEVGSITWTKAGAPFTVPGIPAGQIPGQVTLFQGELSAANKMVGTGQYVKTAAGNDVIYTNGVDDRLETSVFAIDLSQPNTVFLVCTIEDNNADQVIFDGIQQTKEHALWVDDGTSLMRLDAGTVRATPTGPDYGNVHIWVIQFNGATSKLWRSGGSSASPLPADIGAEVLSGMSIGSAAEGSQYAKVTYEYLVVNDGSMTLAQINAIGAQLALETSGSWTTAT